MKNLAKDYRDIFFVLNQENRYQKLITFCFELDFRRPSYGNNSSIIDYNLTVNGIATLATSDTSYLGGSTL